MPVTFKIPKSPSKSVETMSDFRGVDVTNAAAACDKRQSPEAMNMIRDVPGKVRKRMGFEIYDNSFLNIGECYGFHTRLNATYDLYHIGEGLYRSDTKANILDVQGQPLKKMNKHISHSWEYDGRVYIQDGEHFYVWENDTVNTVAGYIPTLTIAKAPSGGGQEYEPFNLLSMWYTEKFAGTANDTMYYMTLGFEDAFGSTVKVMNAQGVWETKIAGTDYELDEANSAVRFFTAPGVSPLTGEDNVEITVAHYVDDYRSRIEKCTIGTRFGVNGAFDRLFVSGNPDWPNVDWYSGQWDLTYFPDTGYSRLGSSKSAIVGYSMISNYLAAHKDENEHDLSIILRAGDMVDNKASFRIVNTLQGPGAIATETFQYLSTEPVFLTRSGVYAVTAQDITGEKYSQSRSFYINGELLSWSESKLKEATSIVYNDMYLLAIKRNVVVGQDNGSRIYVLDGLQPLRTDKSDPYSTRQYAAFICDLPVYVNAFWVKGGRLFFGTANGVIMRFYNDKNALESYSDQMNPTYKKAISCQWDTPDLDGQLFYKNKTLRYIAVRLGAAIATSVKIEGMDRGLWRLLTEDAATGRYLVFSKITFSKFTFSSDMTQKTLHTKTKIKKVDKFRLRLTNDEINEPFFLYDIGMEYVENGYYKG